MISTINELCQSIHADNVAAGWWTDLNTNEPLKRNVGELLMLVVTELAEAADGHEFGLPDDKLPHRPMLEVELADTAIRIYDMGGGLRLDLAGAIADIGMGADIFSETDTVESKLFRLVRYAAAAMEGHRKNDADIALTSRKKFEVRLALTLAGIYELANSESYDLNAAIEEKREFNRRRADHKPENRRAEGGKKC